jgi:hypothetical protein
VHPARSFGVLPPSLAARYLGPLQSLSHNLSSGEKEDSLAFVRITIVTIFHPDIWIGRVMVTLCGLPSGANVRDTF